MIIRPNAITGATLRNGGGSINYLYDNRGNRTSETRTGNQTLYTYDGHDLLVKSEQGLGDYMYFRYGVDKQRYYKHDEINNEVTLYGGKDYERIYTSGGDLKESKFYVTDYLTVTRGFNQGYQHHYVQKDRLGSTTQVLDENGNRIHARSYDAFGKPRNGDWTERDTASVFTATLEFTNPDGSGDTDISKRGFTDHEHLDDWQLIHMNGRMFDYNNGRFLSVDPFIQNPSSTQSLNPYTYIFNNPLSGTDPTGYTAEDTGGPALTLGGGNRSCGLLEVCNPLGRFNLSAGGNGQEGQSGDQSESEDIVHLGTFRVKGDAGEGQFNPFAGTEGAVFKSLGFRGGLKFFADQFYDPSLSEVPNIDELRAQYYHEMYNPQNGHYWRYSALEQAGMLAITVKGVQIGKNVASNVNFVRTASSAEAIPVWHGAGPGKFLGMNSLSKSNKLISTHNPPEPVLFVFDSNTRTFIVARESVSEGGGFHRQLAGSIGIGADSKTIVGGVFRRGKNGEILTNERSGTFGDNWNPKVRTQFREAMKEYGLEHKHLEEF
ncbi:RHS repeat domain-containing protein [Marinicella sp. W31]|uniref:RHS repeat domain-containing protein n=1 Tax=Marinicella sp. W31 TaxID=3023713 RepID=UPI0037578574